MSKIREKLKNMKPEERKAFIEEQFVEIYGEQALQYPGSKKRAVLFWYDQLESQDEIEFYYQLGLSRRKEYLETGDVSSGMMVSYDDYK